MGIDPFLSFLSFLVNGLDQFLRVIYNKAPVFFHETSKKPLYFIFLLKHPWIRGQAGKKVDAITTLTVFFFFDHFTPFLYWKVEKAYLSLATFTFQKGKNRMK